MGITLVNAQDSVAMERARTELAAGRPLGVPTETVYGLLAEVRNPENIAYLRTAGAAPVTGPLAVHLGPAYPLSELVGRGSALFRRLIRKAWPGPLTILLEQPAEKFGPAFRALTEQVKSEITARAADGVLGIQLRCPQGPWIGDLLDSAAQDGRGPLAAVGLSAGNSPAVEADQAKMAIEQRNIGWARPGGCTLLVDAGPTRYGRPSTVVRVRGERWSLVRAGVWDERTVRRLAKLTLLLVCTGNTCRSPMAAALMRQAMAKKLGLPREELATLGIEIISAGTGAFEGLPASPPAVTAMRRRGLDLASHRSRRITAAMVQASDLVLMMTPGQREEVLATNPMESDKIRMLGDRPVMDPVGGDEQEYETIARELERMAARLVEELDL